MRWPEELQVALSTRGFADEVRALLARARTLGLEPVDLAVAAARDDRPDWAAVADFLAEYLDVLDARGLHRLQRAGAPRGRVRRDADAGVRSCAARYDLGRRRRVPGHRPGAGAVAARAGRRRPRPRRRRRPGPVDLRLPRRGGARPAGVRRPVPHDGRASPPRCCTLAGVAPRRRRRCSTRPVGWRGGSRWPAARWPGTCARTASSSPAPGLPRRVRSRCGPTLRAAPSWRRRRPAAPRAPRRRARRGARWRCWSGPARGRSPRCGGCWARPGCRSRSPATSCRWPARPAVAPLLLALRVAVDLAAVDRTDAGLGAEQTRSPPTWRGRCCSRRSAAWTRPRCAGSAAALRDDERAGVGRTPRTRSAGCRSPATELVRDALAAARGAGRCWAAGFAAGRDRRPGDPAGTLVRGRGRPGRRQGRAHEVLWALWNGTPWPRRLARALDARWPGRTRRRPRPGRGRRAVRPGRPRRRAHRAPRRRAASSTSCSAQQIPADTLSERGVRGEGVRVLTAHRSKGLEWPVVVVVDVQEDVWPDLRHRGSLLEPDRLGRRRPERAAVRGRAAGRRAPVVLRRGHPGAAACSSSPPSTRRRTTACARPGSWPSSGSTVVRVRDRPGVRCTLPALVAELRAVAADADAAEPLRRVAADRLATLAVEQTADVRLVPAADPTTWWGLDDPSDPRSRCTPTTRRSCCPGPRSPGSRTARCGGSSSTRCTPRAPSPPRWASASVVHALAHDVGRGETPADLEHLVAPRRLGLEPARVRGAVAVGARARQRARRARPVPGVARTPSAAASCWAPSTASRSRSASAAGPCGCAARWTGSRSTTTAPCTSST